MKDEPARDKYLRRAGYAATNCMSPSPKESKSRMNPIVAPDTNGNVLRNPWVAPEAIIVMLTGPGEMDMVNENIHMAAMRESILTSLFGFCFGFKN